MAFLELKVDSGELRTWLREYGFLLPVPQAEWLEKVYRRFYNPLIYSVRNIFWGLHQAMASNLIEMIDLHQP